MQKLLSALSSWAVNKDDENTESSQRKSLFHWLIMDWKGMKSPNYFSQLDHISNIYNI